MNGLSFRKADFPGADCIPLSIRSRLRYDLG
jgi:hypothetical protein